MRLLWLAVALVCVVGCSGGQAYPTPALVQDISVNGITIGQKSSSLRNVLSGVGPDLADGSYRAWDESAYIVLKSGSVSSISVFEDKIPVFVKTKKIYVGDEKSVILSVMGKPTSTSVGRDGPEKVDGWSYDGGRIWLNLDGSPLRLTAIYLRGSR